MGISETSLDVLLDAMTYYLMALSYQSSKQYGVLEGTVQSTTVGSSPTVVRLSPVMTGQDSSRRK